jgi:Tail tubular protein
MKVDFTPDANGVVEFPCGILRVEGPGSEAAVIRGNTLYDSRAGTTRLKQIKGVTVVVELDFLDLPPMAQIHVRDRAVYDFQQDFDSTEGRRAQLEKQARESLIECNAEHTRAVKANRLLIPTTLNAILASAGLTSRGLDSR